MRDSDCGDRVRISPVICDELSLMAGALISIDVSQRSSNSSTIRACGLRMANERPRACPNPDEDGSRDREGVLGDAVPDVEEEELKGPIGNPLYSA